MEKSVTPPRDTEVVDYDDTKKVAPPMDDGVMAGEISGEVSDMDTSRADLEKQKTAEGTAHFNRLGWKRLTVVLIVEAIALGSLSLPKVFATLGMVAGVILCVSLGLLAIWTSDMVGQVKLRFPEVAHYADAGKLVAGRWGYEIVGAMFAAQLIFLVGSHCLTGTIAFNTIIDQPGVCKVIYGVVSAILLLFVAIPPSFAEVAILGYIDFVSIVLAIGLTIIATGVQSSQSIGLSNVNWSAWPKEGITFTEAFIAISNIVFAYSFSMCQFSFMDEMHTLKDYKKSIWALGLTEIFMYTLTGSLIYAFVGQEVQAPALLSAHGVIPRIAFGIALPVIFISGSINTVVVGRYIHGRMYKDSITRFINTPKGWISWLILITIVTIVAFLIAEVIPIFEDLLSISSSLFISGFSFYFPAIMWYCLLREGPWYARHNWWPAFLNIVCFIVGIVVLVAGTYASVDDIILSFRNHTVTGVFQC